MIRRTDANTAKPWYSTMAHDLLGGGIFSNVITALLTRGTWTCWHDSKKPHPRRLGAALDGLEEALPATYRHSERLIHAVGPD
jgi:hypothetical protein